MANLAMQQVQRELAYILLDARTISTAMLKLPNDGNLEDYPRELATIDEALEDIQMFVKSVRTVPADVKR